MESVIVPIVQIYSSKVLLETMGHWEHPIEDFKFVLDKEQLSFGKVFLLAIVVLGGTNNTLNNGMG